MTRINKCPRMSKFQTTKRPKNKQIKMIKITGGGGQNIPGLVKGNASFAPAPTATLLPTMSIDGSPAP